MKFDKFMFYLVFWINWFCIKLVWYSLGYLAHNSFILWAEQDGDRKGLRTSYDISWSVIELRIFFIILGMYMTILDWTPWILGIMYISDSLACDIYTLFFALWFRLSWLEPGASQADAWPQPFLLGGRVGVSQL